MPGVRRHRTAGTGTLTLMVGGDDEAVEPARPVLEMLGEKLFRTGRSVPGTR